MNLKIMMDEKNKDSIIIISLVVKLESIKL